MRKYGVGAMIFRMKRRAEVAFLPQRPCAGFTLIEVLVAITVIAIGFLGTASLMNSTVIGNSTGLSISGATQAAADQLERLRALAFTDALLQDQQAAGNPFFGTGGLRNPMPSQAQMNAGVMDLPDTVNRPADFQITTADGNHTIYWNIADNIPVNNAKTVVVVATSTGRGVQKTVVLKTTINQPI